MSAELEKKSKRIATFDLIRGYFMVSIILNHLQWFPSGLDLVAMRGSLLVSAAEGFFLVSGIVLGIVRGRKLLNKPFQLGAQLLIKRGVVLYITSVILALLFTLLGWWFFMDNPGLKAGIRPPDQPLWEVILGIFSFNYIYGWADFLRLYAVFLLVSPFALLLLRKNLWWLLLVVSAIVWSTYPWALTHSVGSGELLMILSWQFIFFAGLTIGFYWQPLSDWWYRQTTRLRACILRPILLVAALSLVMNIVVEGMIAFNIAPASLETLYQTTWLHFVKEELPLPRLLLFASWFILGFYIFHTYEAFIVRFFGWILLPFGQNSLYVYILHAVLIFFAHLIMPPDLATNPLVNLLGTVLIFALIYTAVKRQVLFSVIPR